MHTCVCYEGLTGECIRACATRGLTGECMRACVRLKRKQVLQCEIIDVFDGFIFEKLTIL